jgi:hypothetical protein
LEKSVKKAAELQDAILKRFGEKLEYRSLGRWDVCECPIINELELHTSI